MHQSAKNGPPTSPASAETPPPATRPRRSRTADRQRRSQWCILEALRTCRLPHRAKVLDIPCGAGELAALLVGEGYRVTAADSSLYVLAEARSRWSDRIAEDPDLRYAVQFDHADVFDTGYGDATFDAVICDRTLQQPADAFTRVALLAELGRITRQWVVVSFLNAATVQGALFHFRARVLRKRQTVSAPIMLSRLRRDAAEAGLVFSAMIATRGPLSPRCYAILRKAQQTA